MIYLFNSANRPRYAKNVLNTLYLPEHCANEYRYRSGGDKPNISDAFYSALKKMELGTDCVVIFIDRYATGGYAYHPLRRAQFLAYRVIAEYVYVSVELLEFIYPQNLSRFNESLIDHLKKDGMPSLKDGDPENRYDGNYAIQSDGIFDHSEDFKTKDDAWTSAITALSATKALRTDDEQWPVFLKVAVQSRKNRLALLPIDQDKGKLFKLTKDDVFELVLTYNFPQQLRDKTSEGHIHVKLGENIKALSGSSFSIDSVSNSAIVPFTSRRYAEDNRGTIVLEVPEQESKTQLLLPDAHIEYFLKDGTGFWVQIVVALALYASAGAMIGIDFAKLSPFTWTALGKAALPRVLLALGQAGGLFWLFNRIGKKVL